MMLSTGLVLLAVGGLAIVIYLLIAERRGWKMTLRAVVLESLCVVLSAASSLAALLLIVFAPLGSTVREPLSSGASAISKTAVPVPLLMDLNAVKLLSAALLLSIVPLGTLRWRRRYVVELAAGLLLSIFVLLSIATVGLAFFPSALFMLAAAGSGMFARGE